jgi:thiamine transporter
MENFIQKFSDFSMSAAGQLVYAAVALVIVMAVAGYFFKKKFTVKIMTAAAACLTLAVVLWAFSPLHLPQGGTVTLCSMFFLAYIGYMFGPAVGIIGGITFGFIHIALKPYVVHPVQLFLDYPLAFASLGVTGFFRKRKIIIQTAAGKWKINIGLHIGYIAGVLLRGFMHVLSGVIFFSIYAEGQNVWIYSIGYNATYLVPEMIATLIIISVPVVSAALERVKADAV